MEQYLDDASAGVTKTSHMTHVRSTSTASLSSTSLERGEAGPIILDAALAEVAKAKMILGNPTALGRCSIQTKRAQNCIRS